MANRGDGLLVYRDCRLIGGGQEESAAIASLLASLNRVAVEKCNVFAAHAGVVAVGRGAIALPAVSGRGKSTLTAGCLLAGFRYVSDEAICVDMPSGNVIPYPKPLGLSERSRQMLGIDESASPFPAGASEGFFTPASLGAETVSGPTRLQHVVIPEYGHEGAELTEVAASEAMGALLEMSFNHYKFGVDAFRLAAALANRSRAWRLRYGDPLEAGQLLMDRLGTG